MKTLLQTMAAVMLAATIVPVCADEPQKREATKAEIESCGTSAGIAELTGFLTGILPMAVTYAVVDSKIYSALLPISKYLASGIAIPGGVMAGLATMMVFQIPYHLLMKYYEKTYDEESIKKIVWRGQDKSENWMMNAALGIPAACVAGCLSFAIASKIASLA
jgi:hypothetical protein